MTTFTATAHFQAWAAQRRADPNLPADAAKAAAGVRRIRAEIRENHRTANSFVEKPNELRRGRPPLSTANPVAHIIQLISYNRPPWLDDIVYGSVATAVGSNKGQLRVRSGDVLAALRLEIIVVKTIQQSGMSNRTAQEIAKAARHAVHGIESYLNRHSAKLKQLTAAAGLVAEMAHQSYLTRGVIGKAA
ncbi:hypothetical protein [Pseudomonas helleri]|uniref:hypothetical protein n=1 Tax=Pseudomonas helleri TaxID=1608996 RepID=UPI003FD61116